MLVVLGEHDLGELLRVVDDDTVPFLRVSGSAVGKPRMNMYVPEGRSICRMSQIVGTNSMQARCAVHALSPDHTNKRVHVFSIYDYIVHAHVTFFTATRAGTWFQQNTPPYTPHRLHDRAYLGLSSGSKKACEY